jgi:hypothetical protein
MELNQPVQPANPSTPPRPSPRKKVAPRTRLILSLMLGPVVLFALTFIAYTIVNLTVGFIPAVNTFLYIIGGIAVVAWLPGIIAGVILLIKQPKQL